MPELFLPIVPIDGIEPEYTWEDYCQDPAKFLREFANNFTVKATALAGNSSLYQSQDIPPVTERDKIWVKTSWPYGIGIFIDGQYQMDYGASGMVPNTPFLSPLSRFTPNPGNVNLMSDQQIADYGMQNTSGNPATRMRWWIFEPEAIEV